MAQNRNPKRRFANVNTGCPAKNPDLNPTEHLRTGTMI